ncbi:hypothetical protein [Thermomonospora umbrina]|uniref:DUF317 domain-containing protein n=1 Tax=Thermomonospora umbrina TaxID=111806 RepID=A0A3D9SXY9_9ACTN|nr:hypothetical protein [Thermomonospora umbrina]REF00833.1 hypothetical protein DFJ69_6415 [Thermomonospora umbrina]
MPEQTSAERVVHEPSRTADGVRSTTPPTGSAGARAPRVDADHRTRGEALQELGELLRSQQYAVRREGLHLSVRDGGRPVEVWVWHRPDDQNRLWFTWAGGIPIGEVSNPVDTVVAVKTALRQINSWSPTPDRVRA